MPLKELKSSLSRMGKSELEELNTMGRSTLHFAARSVMLMLLLLLPLLLFFSLLLLYLISLRYSKVELVEYLLERGMEVDAVGEEGMTALHYVSR